MICSFNHSHPFVTPLFALHLDRDRVDTGTNRAKTDGLAREIMSLNACFQSVMKASYVMKAARRALTHQHSFFPKVIPNLLYGQNKHKCKFNSFIPTPQLHTLVYALL